MARTGWIIAGFAALCAARAPARPVKFDLSRIEGAAAVPEAELRDSLDRMRGQLIESAAARDTLAAMARHTRELYYARGFYFMRIDSLALDYSADSSRARATIYLEEGRRVAVDSVIVAGDSALGARRIRRALQTRAGDALDPQTLADDIETLLTMYENDGYPFAAIEVADIRFDSAGGLVVIVNARQGAHVIVADIVSAAPVETSPGVIRRASGVPLGAPYDQRRVNEIKQKFERLQIFASVGEPVLVMRSAREAVLRVPLTEGNTTLIDGVIGYVPPAAPAAGYVTGIVDISFLDLFGSARKFGFHWQRRERNSQDLWATYEEPWALGFPVTADLRIEQQEQDTLYTRRSLQLNAVAGFADRFTITGSLSYTSTVPGSSDSAAAFPASSENAAGVALGYDTRDNVYNPRSGVFYSSGYSAGVKSVSSSPGAAPIQRISVDMEFYDEFVSGSVAALMLHGASVVSSALDFSDLYRVGGYGSIRGYADYQFRASRLLWGTAEYRLLTSRLSFLSAFADAGYYVQTATFTQPEAQQGLLFGYGVGAQVESPLGLIRVSFALGKGEAFSQAKVHVGVVNKF